MAVLQFAPIDIDRHADLCVAFRRDSFALSFAGPNRFDEEIGAEAYLGWLRGIAADNPGGCVHALEAGRIVGQIEAGRLADREAAGYVYLYYLAPKARGRRYGDALDAYTEQWFRGQGIVEARLAVSTTNAPARRFYARRGWTEIGPRPGKRGELLLLRRYADAAGGT